ncbi:MAG: serine hydrolase domain-containing protein [Steroidobacteraceae bacterium]
MRRHIDAGDIPGAVVLVARSGRVVYLDAIGNIDAQTPLRQDTIFWAASMTKPVVATAVLMMVEEGKVTLGDPVSRFIPEFKARAMVRMPRAGSPPPGGGPDTPKPQYDLLPATRPITVQDLLTHTSGLQVIGVPNEHIAPLQAGDTLAKWVPGLGHVPLEFQPGTKWGYSNATGFDVLARIVEVASGQPFDAFVRQRIFMPLGMQSSSFGPRADLAARNMPVAPPLADNPCINGKTFICGSAGLWTSAADYARFAQMLLNGGELDGKRILGPRQVAALHANHTGKLFPGSSGVPGADKGVGFGFGVVVVQDAAAAGLAVSDGSYGWDGVGTRRFWVIPQQQMVIVMLVPSGKAAPVHREIEGIAMSALLTGS